MDLPSGTWALILGGSSGMGLAAADKLARHGMNCCIVHRDRRGAMPAIEKSFDRLRSRGVRVLTHNTDALSDEGRAGVLDSLEKELAGEGRVRLLLHSIALGNLKLLAPDKGASAGHQRSDSLAQALGLSPERVAEAVEQCFAEGTEALHALAAPPRYPERILSREDFAHTVHAMGTSLFDWVAEIQDRRLFYPDARVLALTSEGNAIAWRGYAAVSAAKAALESLCRSIAVEFAPYGIRANVIQAGVTLTPALAAIPGNRQIAARAALRNPMGRLTRPEDVADAVYLLCRDEAAWINGALLCVDGGERIT
ncbi:MAG: SDR family oxidoreductase [Thermodesulfobacteriota bacterium]